MQVEQFYTVKEVAQLLKMTDGTIRNWISNGKIKAVKIGGDNKQSQTRIAESELKKLLNPIE